MDKIGEPIWKGGPSFRRAFTQRGVFATKVLVALFFLGWLLSNVRVCSGIDPLSSALPTLLIYGSPLWIAAIFYSTNSRKSSGYETIRYLVYRDYAVVLGVGKRISDRSGRTQAEIVGKWSLDGTITPIIVGNHISFESANSQGKSLAENEPVAENGFVFLNNATEVQDILTLQIKSHKHPPL